MHELTSWFDEVSGLVLFLVGANMQGKKKLAKFIYDVVEEFVTGKNGHESQIPVASEGHLWNTARIFWKVCMMCEYI